MSGADYIALMGPVALKLWGDPTDAGKGEMRWGSHGSKSVDLQKGTWFDHETKEGGGVLDLVERVAKVRGPERFAWLREHGFDVGEPEPPASRANGANGHARPGEAAAKPKPKLVKTYDYVDAEGSLVYQVCRFEPKTFRQRRPDPDKPGEWIWSVKGLTLVPYRLPDLQEAIANDQTIFVVEGEKDVDSLWSKGIPATCNPMGAGKWTDDLTAHFLGARVVILPDNDDAGRSHRDLVAGALKPIAASVKSVDLPRLELKGDVSDWLAQGGTDAELYELVERTPEWTPGARASRFGAVRFRDRNSIVTRPEWMVDDLLPEHSLILLYGASQSGKSFLGVDWGLRIAMGDEIFGHRAKPGGVIYQAGEGGRGLIKRMKAFAIEHKLPRDLDIPFVLLTKEADLYHRDGDTPALIEEIKELASEMPVPLSMVAVDTLATASPGANENASEDMSLIVANLKRIQEECNAAVMLIHHKNAAGERPRGHTSLFAAMDTAIEVTRDDYGGRTAKVSKQKDAEDGAKFEFRLQSVTIGSYDDGKLITSCVVVPAHAGSRPTGDRARVRLSPRTEIARQALLYVLGEYGKPPPPMLPLIPSNAAAVVDIAAWRKVFLDRAFLGSSDEPTEAAKRQAVFKALDELQKAGVVGGDKASGLMWLVRDIR